MSLVHKTPYKHKNIPKAQVDNPPQFVEIDAFRAAYKRVLDRFHGRVESDSLRNIPEKDRMSVKLLAYMTGRSVPIIDRFIRGYYYPKVNLLILDEVMNALNLSLSDLTRNPKVYVEDNLIGMINMMRTDMDSLISTVLEVSGDQQRRLLSLAGRMQMVTQDMYNCILSTVSNAESLVPVQEINLEGRKEFPDLDDISVSSKEEVMAAQLARLTVKMEHYRQLEEALSTYLDSMDAEYGPLGTLRRVINEQ